MKCLQCIQGFVVGEPVTQEIVQEGVDHADTAVAVHKGQSMCARHLYNDMLYEACRASILKEAILANMEATKKNEPNS